MIDSIIKSKGQFIDYNIFPERKQVQFVSFENKKKFDDVLLEYKANKIIVDYNKLNSDNDSAFGRLARISYRSVYFLSNGLFAIDQFEENKANPYYVCESLEDFKLITKYLLVFKPDSSSLFEVQCNIHEHFEIKKFIERETKSLKVVDEMSDDRFKVYLSDEGKYIYISYTCNSKAVQKNVFAKALHEILEPFHLNKFENEDVIYWSLVIYESIEHLKFHNADLR